MYSRKMTGDQWLAQITIYADQVVNASLIGKTLYEKFTKLTYGLTDGEILALPQFTGWTIDDLTNVKYALSTLQDMDNALHNIAVAASDRYGYLEPFLLG